MVIPDKYYRLILRLCVYARLVCMCAVYDTISHSDYLQWVVTSRECVHVCACVHVCERIRVTHQPGNI